MEKTFDVEIVTPDRVFYKGTADLLEFNTESGEIGVYRDHIPLTTVLEPGLVTIHHGDEEQVAAVHAGFAEILGDKVTLLAELAKVYSPRISTDPHSYCLPAGYSYPCRLAP